MSRQDRWCKSANDTVIDAWRYACHLSRTTAERIAIFNVEMEQLERRGAAPVRSRAKTRRTLIKATIADLPSRIRRRLS
jgi:hypothetical protein